MTLPRRVLSNTTYLVTRRCTQRMFLLRPSPLNTQIFIYCLAVAAKKTREMKNLSMIYLPPKAINVIPARLSSFRPVGRNLPCKDAPMSRTGMDPRMYATSECQNRIICQAVKNVFDPEHSLSLLCHPDLTAKDV